MAKYTEEALQNAIRDVKSGTSAKRAAKTWGVPRATLPNRVKGSKPRRLAYESLQRLPQDQERLLVKWVVTQGALGCPPTYDEIRKFATRILAKAGDLTPLGNHWIERFMARHPEIKGSRGKCL